MFCNSHYCFCFLCVIDICYITLMNIYKVHDCTYIKTVKNQRNLIYNEQFLYKEIFTSSISFQWTFASIFLLSLTSDIFKDF